MKQPKKIPKLKTEQEEFDFWSTHDSTSFFQDTEEIQEKIDIRKRRVPKKRITMLLDPRLKLKLEKIAAEKKGTHQDKVRVDAQVDRLTTWGQYRVAGTAPRYWSCQRAQFDPILRTAGDAIPQDFSVVVRHRARKIQTTLCVPCASARELTAG